MGAEDSERPLIGAEAGRDDPADPAAVPSPPDTAPPAATAEPVAPQSYSRSDSSRSRRRPPPKPSPGAEFERRVARVEFAEGALARLRVPVFVDAEAGRDQLTDLDVLALEFDKRLRLSRSILECKSGAGQSGEGDRLLWLAGLRSLLRVERAVLVRQTVTRRGQGLAASLNLQILDNATLMLRESAHGWLPDRFAHIDGPVCAAAETRMDTQLKALGHIPAHLVSFLRYKALLSPAHKILSTLVELAGVIDSGGTLPEPTRTLLASHALMALTVAALQDAAALDTMSAERLSRRTELALTVGTPDDGHLLSVLGLADQITTKTIDGVHRAYISQGADRVEVAVPSLREIVASAPTWIDRYLDLVQRMRCSRLTTSPNSRTGLFRRATR